MPAKTQCRYCFTRFDAQGVACRVCQIDPAKNPKALTVDEKKIAYRCRTLYTIGALSIVSGFFGMFLIIPATLFALRGTPKNTGMSMDVFPYYAGGILACLAALPVFGWAVRRYRKWSYGLGIGLYLFFAAIHVYESRPVFAAASLLFIYYIASPPTRKILNTNTDKRGGVVPRDTL